MNTPNSSNLSPSDASHGRRRVGAVRGVLRCLVVAAVLAAGVTAVAGTAVTAQDGSADVRIVARRLDSGKVEFALQQRHADDSWGARLLPSTRLFPTTATVGRWLVSSPLRLSAVSAPSAPPAVSKTLFGHLETDGPCADLPSHAPEGLCLVEAASNTIRLFACGFRGRVDGPDWHWYHDSGRQYYLRTRPLRLEVGTRIEIHNTCETGGGEMLMYVTGFTGPRVRYPVWTDVVHGITICRVMYIYPKGVAPVEPDPPRRPSGDLVRRGTLHPDGRYGLIELTNYQNDCHLP